MLSSPGRWPYEMVVDAVRSKQTAPAFAEHRTDRSRA